MADSQTQEKVREAVAKLSAVLPPAGLREYIVNADTGLIRTLLAAYTRMEADMAEARKLMKPAVKNARLADRVLASDGERMSLTVGELRVLAAFYNKGEG